MSGFIQNADKESNDLNVIEKNFEESSIKIIAVNNLKK